MHIFSKSRVYKCQFFYSFSEYTDFLEDLEEDQTIRQNINIYRGMCSETKDLFMLSVMLFNGISDTVNHLLPVVSPFCFSHVLNISTHSRISTAALVLALVILI